MRDPADKRPEPVAARGGVSAWRKPMGGRIASLACLLAAAALEYYLVNIPLPQEVSGQFPVTVRARAEGISFEKPGLTDGSTFSFEYTPPTEAQPVLVDAYFEKAQLSPETLQNFRSLQVSAPSSPDSMAYLTSTVRQGSCSTKIEVAPVSPPASARFSQTDNDSLAGFRSVAIAFAGSDAEVTLTSQGAMQDLLSPCRVELSVGSWKQTTGGFFPIKIRVPAGANFRFRWQNLSEKSDPWRNRSAALKLLQFGTSAGDRFTASGIKIGGLNLNTGALNSATFEADAERKSPLTVSSFAINKDQLEISASGKGTVTRNGSVVTRTDVIGILNRNPLAAALFGAGNLALLGWVGRSWFPSRRRKRSGR